MATTEEIISGAGCIDCAIPKGLQLAALLWIYQQANNVSIQEMIDGAACIDCAIPKGMQPAVLISLINSGSGGGGGATGTIYELSGSSSPTATPSGPAVAYNEVPNVWVWNAASSTWFQIV